VLLLLLAAVVVAFLKGSATAVWREGRRLCSSLPSLSLETHLPELGTCGVMMGSR
jgi:hypothetical protein